VILTAVRLVPRRMGARSSPISFAPSPRSSVSPCPSWPSLFDPQHLTLPSSSMAQLCAAPAPIATVERGVGVAARGRRRSKNNAHGSVGIKLIGRSDDELEGATTLSTLSKVRAVSARATVGRRAKEKR